MTRRSAINSMTWGLLLLLLAGLSCAAQSPRPTPPSTAVDDRFEAGYSLYKAGEFDKARPELEAYLEYEPRGRHAPAALLALGTICLHQKDYSGAERRFVDLERFFPGTSEAAEGKRLLGVTLEERKRAEAAPPIKTPAPKKEPAASPENTKLTPLTPEDQARLDQFINALKSWENAQKGTPEEKLAADLRLQEAAENLDEPEISQAIRLTAKSPYAHGICLFRKGMLNLHIRRFDDARLSLNELLTQHPDHPFVPRAQEAVNRMDRLERTNPNRIGVLLPLSGKLKAIGEGIRLAMEMAAKDSSLGIELVFADTQEDPGLAVKELERLVLDEQVIALIGTIMGDTAEAAAVKAEQLGVPILLLSPRDKLPEIGHFVFRMMLTARAQTAALIDYSWDVLKRRTYGIMYPNSAFGEEYTFNFWDQVVAKGGWITSAERYEKDLPAYSENVRRLVGHYAVKYYNQKAPCGDPSGWTCTQSELIPLPTTYPSFPAPAFEALFIPDYSRALRAILPYFRKINVFFSTHTEKSWRNAAIYKQQTGRPLRLVQLLGTSSWNQKKMLLHQDIQRLVEGAIFCDGFFAGDTENGKIVAFVAAYSQAAQKEPGTIEAYAYDGVQLLINLISSQQILNRTQLKDSLLAMENYAGLTGDMRFDPDGEILNPPILLTVLNGEIVVAPDTFSDPAEIYTRDDLNQTIEPDSPSLPDQAPTEEPEGSGEEN